MTQRSSTYLLPLFALALMGLHWFNQWQVTYGPMFDEAQYWYWGKVPAWGYYSKPPMIGWLMGIGTALFGDGNFGMKMLSPLILTVTACVLYATSRRLGHARETSAWVFVTYLTLPYILAGGAFFTTDVPLQLCWAVALFGVVSAMRMHKPAYWLLTGVAVGLGLLSKYNMVAFGASTLVALLLTPQARKQLRSPWPYLGGILAFALLAPNILWNAHHQFVTFHHTDDNVFSNRIALYPGDMLTFLLSQLAVFGPILMAVLVRSLWSIKRSDETAFLHCYVWPLAVTGTLVALLSDAQAQWIVPVYIAATLIVVPWMVAHKRVLLPISFGLHLLVMALFYLTPTVLPHLQLKRDPLARLFVWNALAQDIEPIARKYPDAVLMTNERKIAAAFTYELRGLHDTVVPVYKWRNNAQVRDHYDMVTQTADLTKQRILLVLRVPTQDMPKPRKDAKLLSLIDRERYHFAVYLLPAGGQIGQRVP